MPRGFNGPPMRRGMMRGMMPRGMGFRYEKTNDNILQSDFTRMILIWLFVSLCITVVVHLEEVQDVVEGQWISATKTNRNYYWNLCFICLFVWIHAFMYIQFSLWYCSSNQGPSSNDVPQKPDSSPNAVTTTQQAAKQPQTNSHSPNGGDPANSVSINQSTGGPPITKGLYMGVVSFLKIFIWSNSKPNKVLRSELILQCTNKYAWR